MATQRLYFEDAYAREFEASVIEAMIHEGRPAVVLDRTCFYPGSGGQPADRGTLNGVEVLDVVEEGDRIIHVLGAELPARTVRGVVDWPRRFDHMQQHSGQHILSQAFLEVLGGETRSFHLGERISTLEIGVRGITDHEAEAVEGRANRVVFDDLEIRTSFVAEDEIGTIPLRRPPRKEGLIRVVEVSGFDWSACGGTHCRRAGEIGLIKILGWDRIRDNLRFEFVCGGRALQDYGVKNRTLRKIAGRFNVREDDAASAVERLAAEARTLKKDVRRMEETLVGFEAQEYLAKVSGNLVLDILPERTPEGARSLALTIVRRADVVVLFGCKTETRSHVLMAAAESRKLDLRRLIPVLAPLMNGRGGGGPGLVEIAGDASADLKAVLAKAVAELGM